MIGLVLALGGIPVLLMVWIGIGIVNVLKRYDRHKAKTQRELVKLKEHAEKANMQKSKFLANMSHELRTPMHAISGFTNLAIKKNNQQSISRYLDNIKASASRLTDLLNNLLDLAKLEAGKLKLNLVRHDLKDVVAASVSEIESLCLQKNLVINIQSEGDTQGEFDINLLHQVIINLLSNSIKHSPLGASIDILLDEKEGCFDEDEISCLYFSIQDQGHGIPVTELISIFDSFTQSSLTEDNAGGTGLGLPICKEIIELHNGVIWAENAHLDDSSGAVFKFKIPKQGCGQS